ncbi:MAG: DinB family protein [Bacteroidota bacterium]
MYRLTFFFILMVNTVTGQTYDMRNELVNRLHNAAEYTLAVLEKMPEQHLSFQPVEGVRTFAEIIQHIGESQLYTASQGIAVKQLKFKGKRNSKKDLKDFIEESYSLLFSALDKITDQDLQKKVRFWDGQASVFKIMNFTIDHVTHHRGQATIYLRMNGIKPPDYIGW